MKTQVIRLHITTLISAITLTGLTTVATSKAAQNEPPIIIKNSSTETNSANNFEFGDDNLRSDVSIGSEEEIKEISPKKIDIQTEEKEEIGEPIAIGKIVEDQAKEKTKETQETKESEVSPITFEESPSPETKPNQVAQVAQTPTTITTSKETESKETESKKSSSPKLTKEQKTEINTITNQRFEQEKLKKYKEVAAEFQKKIDSIRATGRKLTEEEKKAFKKEFSTAKMKAGSELKKEIKKQVQEELLKKSSN